MNKIKEELQIYKVKTKILESCIKKMCEDDNEIFNKINNYILHTFKQELNILNIKYENNDELEDEIYNYIHNNDSINIFKSPKLFFIKNDYIEEISSISYNNIINQSIKKKLKNTFGNCFNLIKALIEIFQCLRENDLKNNNYKVIEITNGIEDIYMYFILESNDDELIWNEVTYNVFLEEMFNIIKLISIKFNLEKLDYILNYFNKYYQLLNNKYKLSIEFDIKNAFIYNSSTDKHLKCYFKNTISIDNNTSKKHFEKNINIIKDELPGKINYLNLSIDEICDNLKISN